MKKLLRVVILGLVILMLVVSAGVLSWCSYCQIWSWEDWQVNQAMSRECHPVWRDLHSGRIQQGDDVESVIWRTHPNDVEVFENVKMLTYGGGFTGLQITAKDGKVVHASAASCTWTKTFFGKLEGDEWIAFSQRWSAHRDAQWKAKHPH